MVQCSACKTEYPAAYAGSKQCGQGCSSEVVNGRLIGGYGSHVADGMSYLISAASPMRDGSILCDCCIQKGLDNGLLRVEADMMHNLVSQSSQDGRDAIRSSVSNLLSEIAEWVELAAPQRPMSA